MQRPAIPASFSARLTVLLTLLALLVPTVPCAQAQAAPPASTHGSSMHNSSMNNSMQCADCCQTGVTLSAPACCCAAHPQPAEQPTSTSLLVKPLNAAATPFCAPNCVAVRAGLTRVTPYPSPQQHSILRI